MSSEFLHGPTSKGNEFARFGQVADDAEREAASAVLEESLKAKAAEDFGKQCATLSKALYKNILSRAEFVLATNTPSCAKGLEVEAEPLPPSVLLNTMTGQIDVLRVKGRNGYALYHGTHGKDYGVPMVKENGEWKVAGLVTYDLSKG